MNRSPSLKPPLFARAGLIASVLLVVMLLAGRSTPAQASGWIVKCLVQALSEGHVPTHDVTVELELTLGQEALSLLDTENGKVSGLLTDGKTLPLWYVEYASHELHQPGDPGEVEWDRLSPETQLRLLKDISSQNKRDFFSDRRFHGLTVRKTVKLKFDRPVSLLGKEYAAGEHQVDISSAFEPVVEYRGPKAVRDASGVELHFRSRGRAGQISNDAWTLLEGLGLDRVYQHVHVPGALPLVSLRADPETTAALMSDFARRVNLAAEMITIVNEGGTIFTRQEGTAIHFDHLRPRNLQDLVTYFLDVAKGKATGLGDKIKMAWAGVRGHDLYDVPDSWGIEFRSVRRRSDPELTRVLLNEVQRRMQTEDWGITSGQMREWLSLQPAGRDLATTMAGTWYGQSFASLERAIPKRLAPKYEAFSDSFIRELRPKGPGETLTSIIELHGELKMLVFDWGNDPLFHADEELKARILREQERAIDRILDPNVDLVADHSQVTRIMRDFLLDSGIYERVLSSLGVSVSPPSPR